MSEKRCFVVMGFGVKTDYYTGRKLDLDKSYKYLIQPVVKEKGLVCIRADEIRLSGLIDKPMYQELLKADVVIADLSTANLNAFYELGIRHALRPRTTIVISEDKLVYPFDVNHIKITSYTHLGDTIDVEEAERFQKKLGDTIDAVLNDEHPDSPVYTILHNLVPPSLEEKINDAVRAPGAADVNAETGKESLENNQSLAIIIEGGEEAIRQKDYSKAKAFFASAMAICNDPKSNVHTNDSYLIHRLALATYKAAQPDAVTALHEAIKLLEKLNLAHTNDPETVALAGAIEKRLYENKQGDFHLSNAILYYQRGYFLLNNRYNGINLAFMLNARAASALCTTNEERIADMVEASRVRRRVLQICEKDWNAIKAREEKLNVRNEQALPAERQGQSAFDVEQKFWISINRAEAYYGLGEIGKYHEAIAEAMKIKHEKDMLDGLLEQVMKIKKIMEQYGHLLNPAWPGDNSVTQPSVAQA